MTVSNQNFAEHSNENFEDSNSNYECQQLNTSDQMELLKLGLPIDSLMGLKKVNDDLKNENIRVQVEQILQKIGGISGKANGEKTLRLLGGAVIEPNLQANISWSGRGKGAEKKNSHVALR